MLILRFWARNFVLPHFNFTVELKKVFLTAFSFCRFQISIAKPRKFHAAKISCLKVLKLNFQKNKVVSGKVSFFVIGPICTLNSVCLKDTHRENTPSNKTQALTKSTNRDNWVISILNQLLITDFNTRIKFSKK